MSSGSFKNVIYKMCLEIMYLIYMHEKELTLNNLHGLICHKTKSKQLSEPGRSYALDCSYASVDYSQVDYVFLGFFL